MPLYSFVIIWPFGKGGGTPILLSPQGGGRHTYAITRPLLNGVKYTFLPSVAELSFWRTDQKGLLR